MAPMKVRKRKRTKASSPLATSTKEIKDMFQAIGEAITRWQQVESVLFDIFDNCMTCRALGPPAVAFTAVDNFRAKLAMTDAVVRLRLKGSDADLAKWEALRNRTAKPSKKRNTLAHHGVVQLGLGKAKAKPALVPPKYDMRALLDGEPWKISKMWAEDVRGVATKFTRLAIDLGEFLPRTRPPSAQT